MNPFWKSKKFVYALATFCAALIVALAPTFADWANIELKPETLDMMDQMLPLIIAMGLLVITGHTATDLMYLWTEGIKSKELKEAAHDLIEAFPLGEIKPTAESYSPEQADAQSAKLMAEYAAKSG
jgi:hypothetical protein